MLNSGHLVYERYQVDGSFQGRHHERMNQYHSGIRVFGGQLVWQKQSGLVLSVTGNLYDDIGINTTPSLTASQAEARALELEGPEAFAVGDIELSVGTAALQHRSRALRCRDPASALPARVLLKVVDVLDE